MPEAAVDKDYLAARTEYEIGSARQVLCVEAVAVAYPMHKPPDPHFGYRVLAADTAHQRAALTRRHYVKAAFAHESSHLVRGLAV